MRATSGHRGREGRRIWANLGVLPASQSTRRRVPNFPLSEFPGYTVSSPGGSGNSPSRKFLPSQLRDKARKGALSCRDLLQGSRQGGLQGAGQARKGPLNLVCLLVWGCHETLAKSKFVSSWSLLSLVERS